MRSGSPNLCVPYVLMGGARAGRSFSSSLIRTHDDYTTSRDLWRRPPAELSVACTTNDEKVYSDSPGFGDTCSPQVSLPSQVVCTQL